MDMGKYPYLPCKNWQVWVSEWLRSIMCRIPHGPHDDRVFSSGGRTGGILHCWQQTKLHAYSVSGNRSNRQGVFSSGGRTGGILHCWQQIKLHAYKVSQETPNVTSKQHV
jgi:hypothetical protein